VTAGWQEALNKGHLASKKPIPYILRGSLPAKAEIDQKRNWLKKGSPAKWPLTGSSSSSSNHTG